MPSSLGPAEILVILIVALIVLGPSRLPEAGRQMGKALSELRRWSGRVQSELRDALDGEPESPSPPAQPADGRGGVDQGAPPPPSAPDFT